MVSFFIIIIFFNNLILDISDLPENLKMCQHLSILNVSSNPIAR